jgi:prepilin-type N-terminal cleavage/methylation domain-containing protein
MMKDKQGNIKIAAGFSLLEILVAMAILSIIVLTLATVFNQSGIAWDRGLSKSERGMEGRSALNLMTMDLKKAVAGDYLKDAEFSGNSMTFNTMTKIENNTDRLIKYVTYSFSGNSINRTIQGYKDDYSALIPIGSGALIEDVNSFTISAMPSGGTFTTNLPESITLTLKLEKANESALVSAESAGPNGKYGDKDDISSEKRK